LYPNNRIVSGSVSRRAMKEINSYCAFLESLVVSLKAVMNHIGKKLLAALACLKSGTVQD
jgi:hypothetical protein